MDLDLLIAQSSGTVPPNLFQRISEWAYARSAESMIIMSFRMSRGPLKGGWIVGRPSDANAVGVGAGWTVCRSGRSGPSPKGEGRAVPNYKSVALTT